MQSLADRDTDHAALLTLWRTTKDERSSWAADPNVYSRFAERLLGTGEPLPAYDLIDEGLANFPKDERVRQLQRLALVRSGDTERAGRVLGLVAERSRMVPHAPPRGSSRSRDPARLFVMKGGRHKARDRRRVPKSIDARVRQRFLVDAKQIVGARRLVLRSEK